MSELWVNSKLDREWLERFGESWRVYEEYKRKRDFLRNKIIRIPLKYSGFSMICCGLMMNYDKIQRP